MALKLNCIEPLTAIGIGVGACALAPLDAGLTAGAVIGGAGLFARVRENSRKAGLDDKKLVARMQRRILREWDHWDDTQEKRDAVTVADAAMTELLPQVMLTREELAETATESADPDDRYPAMAASKIVDRLATLDPIFATEADEPDGLERGFALEVIERALRAAMEDKDYAVFLTLDIAIELGRAHAETLDSVRELADKIEAGFAAVQRSLSGNELAQLSEQALRGAVARFVSFRPDATTSEVVDAVERFVPDYEALRTRVTALDANDNRVRGAQQAARKALDDGYLDAARRYIAEAADARVDMAADSILEAAEAIVELAQADLLALDWESAHKNWQRASEMLAPIDAAKAEEVTFSAATELQQYGERLAVSAALDRAAKEWDRMRQDAVARKDMPYAAGLANNLGNTLLTQGQRGDRAESVHLLSEAVQAFRDALTIYTRDEMSAGWAMTQNNLGNALQIQGERTGGMKGNRLLAEAVRAYRDALSIYTRDEMPADWAMTQNNLGTALSTSGERTGGVEGIRLLAEAAQAYRDVLSIYMRDEMPADWAMTQNNLGTALAVQGEHTGGAEGARMLDEAVQIYRDVLSVRTRDDMPADWAFTKENIAHALESLAGMTEDKIACAHLRDAEGAMIDALSVYTREHMPFYHEKAARSLAQIRDKIAERCG